MSPTSVRIRDVGKRLRQSTVSYQENRQEVATAFQRNEFIDDALQEAVKPISLKYFLGNDI